MFGDGEVHFQRRTAKGGQRRELALADGFALVSDSDFACGAAEIATVEGADGERGGLAGTEVLGETRAIGGKDDVGCIVAHFWTTRLRDAIGIGASGRDEAGLRPIMFAIDGAFISDVKIPRADAFGIDDDLVVLIALRASSAAVLEGVSGDVIKVATEGNLAFDAL